MEITLLYFTVNNIDIAECGTAQAKSNATLYLTFDAEWIHRKTTIQYADHSINGEITVIRNTDLHCLRNRRYRVDSRRHSATPPCSKRFVPLAFFAEHPKNPIHPRVVFGQTQSQLERIDLTRIRQLIQKTLIGNTGMGMPHRTPFLGDNPDPRGVMTLHAMIRDLVRGPIREHAKRRLKTAIQGVNIDSAHHVGRVVFTPLHQRLTNGHLVPSIGHARRIQRTAHLVNKERTIMPAANIFLSRPDYFHGHALTHRRLNRFDRKVCFFTGAAPKAASH